MMSKSIKSSGIELCLNNLKEKGFSPRTIIDCGAYIGDWTRIAKGIFPESHVLMIEAQKSKENFLIKVCSDFASTVDYELSLLGADNKNDVKFYEMETGSSILEELSNVPRRTVNVLMRTLDTILQEKNIKDVSLLKLDVQGYEIEVLKGARETMKEAEIILLEVSLIQYNKGAPLFDEVTAFMKENGFLLYDICDLIRWFDNTLFQANVIFVKQDSAFRKINFIYNLYPH